MKYLATIVALMLLIGSAKAHGPDVPSAVGTKAEGVSFVCLDPNTLADILTSENQEEYVSRLTDAVNGGNCAPIPAIDVVVSEYVGSVRVTLDPPGTCWIYGFVIPSGSGRTLYFFHAHLDRDSKGA